MVLNKGNSIAYNTEVFIVNGDSILHNCINSVRSLHCVNIRSLPYLKVLHHSTRSKYTLVLQQIWLQIMQPKQKFKSTKNYTF